MGIMGNSNSVDQRRFLIEKSTLPDGWISHYDSSANTLSYILVATGESTPTHPAGDQYNSVELQRMNSLRTRFLTHLTHPRYNKHVSFVQFYNDNGGLGPGSAIGSIIESGQVANAVAIEKALQVSYGPPSMSPLNQKDSKGTTLQFSQSLGGWSGVGNANLEMGRNTYVVMPHKNPLMQAITAPTGGGL